MSFNTNGKLRKVVAIGDIHGDYYRILRILEEQQILIPGTLVWDPFSNNVDLVFIGDYVDWRNELLEGDKKEWDKGPYKVLWLLRFLVETTEKLNKKDKSFKSKVYIIMGNHDDMMMESFFNIFKLKDEEIDQIVNDPVGTGYLVVAQNYMELGKKDIVEDIMRFMNWFVQGGQHTINSFGGLYEWKKSLEGDMGKFLDKHLRLGKIINNKLYTHSVPDRKEFWINIENAGNIKCGVKDKLKDAYLWGRKIWGYDYQTGQRTKPHTSAEVDDMLRRCGVKGFVVGHTPMKKDYPVMAYEGRIVNIDLHGVPGSQPYVEIYYKDDSQDKKQDNDKKHDKKHDKSDSSQNKKHDQ